MSRSVCVCIASFYARIHQSSPVAWSRADSACCADAGTLPAVPLHLLVVQEEVAVESSYFVQWRIFAVRRSVAHMRSWDNLKYDNIPASVGLQWRTSEG